MKKAAKWFISFKACMSSAGRISNFRRPKRRLIEACVALLGALVLVSGLAQAGTVQEDDILVIDAGSDKLIRVDGKTGMRSVLSDFNDRSEGPGNGSHPSLTSVAVGRGQVFVTDGLAGLFIVDPSNGHRKFIPFYDGSVRGQFSPGLAVDVTGRVLGNLQMEVTNGSDSVVVRVDPRTDKRAVITDLPATSCCQITDLTLEQPTARRPEGAILIATGPHPDGIGLPEIDRVNPVTGVRSSVSNLGDATQGVVADLHCSIGLAVERSGTILANAGGCLFERNLLVRIDPSSGYRTVVSDFDNPDLGPVGANLRGLGVQHSGQIIVGAFDPKRTSDSYLYRVDPRTGRRVLFSDFTNPRQGPKSYGSDYLVVVPHDAGFFTPPPAGAYLSPFGATQ